MSAYVSYAVSYTIMCTFLTSPICAACPTCHILHDLITLTIFDMKTDDINCKIFSFYFNTVLLTSRIYFIYKLCP